MRRTYARRGEAVLALWAFTALALLGAGLPLPKKKRSEPPPPKVEEAVGDAAFIGSPMDMRLEGVGLVVGLDNTGGDSPQSYYRTTLINEMRKAQVDNPSKLLTDPSVAMVIVRLKVPVGTTTSDRLDVELELPPNSNTKSLAGGYLLTCQLRETLIAKGGEVKEGAPLAVAQGPVMTGTEAKPDNLKVGRVLGAARVKKNTPFTLIIKENRRSFRTAALLEKVVNDRFPQHEGVDLKGAATAKRDTFLELKVPRIYHHHHYRFFRVVKLLPLVDSPSLREKRMEMWGKDLLDPQKSGVASLRLEGLGSSAIETLKTGLSSPNSQVRFLAAESLAFLNDESGAEVLAQTAVKTPEFRSYALAALAATDQPASRMKLIKLMDQPDVEVRYGAFDSLRTLDPEDSFLGRVRVLDQEPEPEESDSMSIAIASVNRRRKPLKEDPFELYVIDCEGPPLVHVSRTRRNEVVVFGRDQKLLTPIVLRTGPILLNAADGDEKLQISRIAPTQVGDLDTKVSSRLEVADVLRETANLGARYPDVVTLLQAASRQKNMAGPLVLDAVPTPSALYDEAAILGRDMTKKDDNLKKTKLEEPKKGFFGRMFGPIFKR
ncbi:flagellar basal body P-ring protein FlgI [Singulisphaera rosea]